MRRFAIEVPDDVAAVAVNQDRLVPRATKKQWKARAKLLDFGKIYATMILSDPAIRRSGDPAIRRSGDPAIRRTCRRRLSPDSEFN